MSIRKTIPILSLIILIACIFGTATAANGKKNKENKIVLEYNFSAPVISSGVDYDTVRMEDTSSYQRTGAPIIPIRPVRVLIPYGKKIAACNVTALDTHQVPGTYRLAPAQKPYPLSFKGPIEVTKPDMAVYGRAKNWPGTYYEQLPAQSKRGYQIFTVNLFPLQYLPTTGEISYAEKMRLEIDLADETASGIVKPSKAVKKKLSISVDNPDALASYPVEGETQQMAASTSLPEGGPYKYIVITSQDLKDANGPWNFQSLCDAKNADGITAGIVTTEWIYANYPGNKPNGGSDNQTQIRNFLIDAYQNWGTEYVLLGGTNAIVPARMFSVNFTTMPVDMYYGCVEPAACTFDFDADDLYGENTDGVNGGEVDLFAEIFVGRAPVENATELARFIKKTLTYSWTEREYLPRITMLGEFLGFGGASQYATGMMEQIRTGGAFDGYFTYGFENNIKPDFYDFDTSTNLYDSEEYEWPKSELLNLMNSGVHVFNHLGHANDVYAMKLYTSDLASLTNDDYFFVYSQGCTPGSFDTPNCFAEVITTMEHGAFAVIMNARSGWGMPFSTDGPSHRFARQFWDAVLGEEPEKMEIGRANQDSKEDNFYNINGQNIRWCYYELNLFGDPQQTFNFTFATSRGINLNRTFYNCDTNVGIRVSDIDLVEEEQCYVDVNTSGGDLETITLSQIVPGTGVFSGYIHTVSGTPNPDDGELQVANGQLITATYYDANDVNGNPAICQDTAEVDCVSPVIYNLDFNDPVIGSYQTISFQTDENTTAKIICGKTCGSPEIVLNDSLLRQSHSFTFNNMDEATYYFKIEVIDQADNITNDDDNGNCYSFMRRDIYVPADYNTIQEAIDASQDGDIIVVAEDTYTESIDLKNKDILVRSTDPNDLNVVSATIINGNGAEDTVKKCTTSGQLSCQVSGFTITGGNHGIFCGAMAIRNCIITGNADIGAYCPAGHLSLENCIIKDNNNFGIKGQTMQVSNSEVSDNHIGIQIDGIGSTINNCTIFNNDQKGVYANFTVHIKNSLIYGNGNGFEADTTNSNSIYNCTITKNTNYGVTGGMKLRVKNCILWNNLVDDINGCKATYSCISDCNEVNEANHNICSNPNFVDAGSNDFHLNPSSLCIDEGDPNEFYAGQTDIDGETRGIYSRVDMGADEVKKDYLSPGAHWWKLDETSETTAYDSVGITNGAFNGNDPCWVSGYINGAADFNGVSDYFAVSGLDDSYSPYMNNAFSIAGWFKTLQSAGIQTIVGNWSQWLQELRPGQFVDGYAGWQILVENNKLVARFGRIEKGIDDITGIRDVNDGQWHHFALVFNTRSFCSSLYLDGQKEAAKTTYGNTNSCKFRIGDGTYVRDGYNPPEVLKGGPFCGTIDDIMIFNTVLNADEVNQLYHQDVREKAFNPNPANGVSNIASNVVLSWYSGASATSQDIYFGLSYNAVNSATHNSPEWMGNQKSNSWDVSNYDPAGLTFSTTYYWRIDEVNTVGTTKGDVWSFTTETGKPFNPQPTNGQTNISLTPVLSWSPGSMATSHDIYFGKDYFVISNANTGYAEYMGRQDVNSWQADCDANDAVYYWRIDEISGSTITKGDVWCFQTVHYPNLISWFKLDEWIDDSTGNHDDGDFGDSTDGDFVAGIIDNALLLNFGYGYVDSLNDYFGPTSTFTISGWFNTTQTTGIQTIVGQWSQKEYGSYNYYGWQIIVYNNKVVARFPYEDSSITNVSGTSTVTDGKWHYFALVYNNNYGYMNINLYVDGQPEASNNLGCTWLVYDTKFRIGDGSYVIYGNPPLQGGQFYGKIDQVKLFDTDLTGSQVQQLYREGTKVHNITRDKWYVYIQKAVADACNGDEIAAYPGVYEESVSAGTWQYSKTYNIHSIDPNNWDIVAATVIDNNGATNTVNFGLNTSGNFSGFTINGGHRGLYLSNANFAVRRCIIEDCNRGVEMSCATANLYNSIIRGNRNYGITLGSTTNSIKNNLICDNNEGIYFGGYVSGNVRNNTIVNNSGHGIYCGPYYASCNVKNSILWNNGDDLFGNCTATYSDIKDGDTGTGNICSDPCFIDTDFFHIGSNSPCIDIGDPNINYSGEKDIDNDIRVIDISGKGDGNNDIDIGADEYNPGS
jgi:hypothetical protein